MHRHVPFCVGLVGLLVLIQSAAAQCMPGDRPFGQNLCLTMPPMVDRYQVGGCRVGETVNNPYLEGYLYMDRRGTGIVCSIPDATQQKPSRELPCPAGYATLGTWCYQCPAGFSAVGPYCYYYPGMVTVREPAECLPGQRRGPAPHSCFYDPAAVASAGCAPGESTDKGLCYYYANKTLVTQRGECQSGEQIVGSGSCRRQNSGGEYTVPQVQVPRLTCKGHDRLLPNPSPADGVCAYRPGQPR